MDSEPMHPTEVDQAFFAPHCDQRVLHAPGECEHCDRYPAWQHYRQVVAFIAFTGHEPTADQVPCPSDATRGTGQAHGWGGNRPTRVPEESLPEQTLASAVLYGNEARDVAAELRTEADDIVNDLRTEVDTWWHSGDTHAIATHHDPIIREDPDTDEVVQRGRGQRLVDERGTTRISRSEQERMRRDIKKYRSRSARLRRWLRRMIGRHG